METIRKIMSNILIYSFVAILIWIIMCGFLDYNTIIYSFNPIILVVVTIAYLLLLIVIKKLLIPKLIKIKYIHYILFGVFLILSLIIGYIFRVNPSWDMGQVFNIAKSEALTGTMGGNTYLVSFPNNIMVTIIYTVVFKIITIFNVSDFITTATFFNAFVITFTVIITYYIAKILFDEEKALMVLIIMLMTSPLYLHVSIYYTDSLSMLFSTLILYLILLIEINKNQKRSVFLQVLLALIILIGWKTKITSIFVVLATIVYYFLKGIKKEEFKKIMILVPVLIVSILLYNYVVEDRINNRLDVDNKKMPLEYWIYTGIIGNGGFQEEIFDVINMQSTLEEKKEVGREKIEETLNSYTVNTFIKHLTLKLKYAWTDGTYMAPEKLRREPVNKNIMHEFVLASGKYVKFYKYFPQAMHMGLLILIVLSSIDLAKKQDWKSKKNILVISMYGLIVFLLIWENRSRYILTMLPIYILLGVEGIGIIQNKIYKRRGKA